MLVILFVQALDNCTIYNTFNPRVIIKNAHSYSDAYLAYTIRFVLVNPDKLYLKYISTYIPAEQTTIEVTFYGYISEICTQEQNNIKWFNQVAIITDIEHYNKLKIEQQYIVFIHQQFSTCGFSYNNQLYRFDISLSVNNQELTILDYSAYRGLMLELSSCTTRKYTDLKAENGIMIANEKDIYFPIYNPILRQYGADYGDYLYPMIYVQEETQDLYGGSFYPLPSNSLKQGDKIHSQLSIIFGDQYQNVPKTVQILVGQPFNGEQIKFENITIYNQCVRFYANSPRDIEYPLNSGIIFNIRTKQHVKIDKQGNMYTYYFGPLICVREFTYMPIMFNTFEDPSLKNTCTNLSNIQNDFSSSVKNGSWKYLSNDEIQNKQAILYTEQLILHLLEMCVTSYFSDGYLNCLTLILMMVSLSLIGSNLIISYTKDLFVEKNKFSKKHLVQILICIFVFSILITVQQLIKHYQVLFGFVFFLTLIYIVLHGYYVYQRIQSQEDITQNDLNNQIKFQYVLLFIFQYVIKVIMSILDILLTITDILQIFEYLKIQFYQNRIANIKWILYPANLILNAAESIAYGAYPIILLIISLINQEIMKQDWFKATIQKPSDPLDNKSFLVQILFQLFGYFQGFTYNVFFAYTDGQMINLNITNKQLNNNIQVIIKLYLAGTIYSISKYKLLLEYYQQLNKAVIKMFISLVQVITNMALFLMGIFKTMWYLITLNVKQQLVNSLKVLLLSLAGMVYYLIMLIIDPLVTILLPTSLMLQEFTGSCSFLLQIFGICDHQDVFAKQTELLLNSDKYSVFYRFLASIEVMCVVIFFSILFTYEYKTTVSPIDQWHCFIFSGIFFVTSFITKNIFGQFMAKQHAALLGASIPQPDIQPNIDQNSDSETLINDIPQYTAEKPIQHTSSLKSPQSFQSALISLQSQLSASQSTYHLSLLKIRGDYLHEDDNFQDFLFGFIFSGYGIIPGCGPLLSTIAKYMNSTGFAQNGEWNFSFSTIFDLLQFILLTVGIFWGLKVDVDGGRNHMFWFGAFFVIYQYQMLNGNMENVFGRGIFKRKK
ncbi:Conserved_hypothetical protein [Hexamita inflata]|uniref:Transmembrane protein n=1 Tax=Hexamita inflata TaxID=28002 RepID=A0ABP1GS58_9EUKA